MNRCIDKDKGMLCGVCRWACGALLLTCAALVVLPDEGDRASGPGGAATEAELVCATYRAVVDYIAAFAPEAAEVDMPSVSFVALLPISRDVSEETLGVYDRAARTVSMLAYGCDEMRDRSLWSRPIDERLYESILVHEIAHHVVESIAPKLPIAHQEYVAYVVQFDLMRPDLRAELLELNTTPGFGTFLEIHDLSYAWLGAEFGFAAYRYHLHYPDAVERFVRGTLCEGLPVYYDLDFWLRLSAER